MTRARIRRSTFALFSTAFVVACSKKDAGDAKEPEVQPVVGAETAVAVEQPFTETVGAIGTVEPRAGHFAVLSAPAAARVANVMVSAGQSVAKGAVLVELDQSGFQAALKSAQAAYTTALAARDRLQRLVDQGVSPRKELDQAVADLARADADVVTARRILDLSTLRAPLSGVVTHMNTSLGASVDPSQPLVQIADPTTVDVLLSVESATAARVHVGNAVAIHSGQRSSTDSLAIGDVADVGGVVDTVSRSVAVRVRARMSSRQLRIGESVFGEIAVATRRKAIVIPVEALVPEGDGFKVFVVDSGDVAHAHVVTVGAKTAKMAEILKGVAAGDRVVTYGAFGVEDSSRIVPRGKEGAAPEADAEKKGEPKDSVKKPEGKKPAGKDSAEKP